MTDYGRLLLNTGQVMSLAPTAFKSFFFFRLTRDDQDLTTFYTDTLPRQVNYPLF